jgi:hypothetical protein
MKKLPDSIEPPADRSRRSFLAAAAGAPALLAGSLIPGSTPPQQPAGDPASASTAGRYHVSEHVRTYYRIAARF